MKLEIIWKFQTWWDKKLEVIFDKNYVLIKDLQWYETIISHIDWKNIAKLI